MRASGGAWLGGAIEEEVAELQDTVEQRVDDSGHGYGGGTAAATSAMAEGSEGERHGEWTCPGGSVRDMEAFAASRRWPGKAGKQGGGVASSCARRRAPARLAG